LTKRTDEITDDQVQRATQQIRDFLDELQVANAQRDQDLEDEIRNEGLDIDFGDMGWFLDFNGAVWTGRQGWFEDGRMGRVLVVGADHEQVLLGAADTTPEQVVTALKPATEAWRQRQASLK